MNEAIQDAALVHSIDLAREADFDLGSLRIRPATCEVDWNGNSQTLQRRVMQVLVALADARGSVVSQNELVIRCWRGLSVSDDAIVRCISKLRKLAAGYPDPPFAIETIPGVGYRLTSSTAMDRPAVDRSSPRDRRFNVRALAAALALAILAVVGAGIWLGRGPNQHRSSRVAVQPFETLSGTANARSLARRVPNEIVDAIGDSQIQAVLGGQDNSAAARLAPGLIVTGILRDDGQTTSADVRIEDGTSNAALWSSEFSRRSEQASDLPLEVAARVADVVNTITVARTASPPLTDDTALSALLQTADMIRDPPEGAWAQMIERAQGVVASHPEFAFGHSVLAAAYIEAAEDIDVPDRARAMSDAARNEAVLTLKLDPQDAGAYAILAGLAFGPSSYNYRAAEAILLRGIKVAKHPKAPLGALYQYEGVLLQCVGRFREALSFQLIAQATDQWSPSKMTRLALLYADMGNLPAAKLVLQKAVRRWPNYSGVKAAQLYIAGFYDQPSEALAAINLFRRQTSTGQDRSGIWRSFVEAKAAHSARATAAIIPEIREAADRGAISRENEIIMLAGLGEPSQAIGAANLALDHGRLDPRFLFTPVMRDVWRDPGFIGLAERVGLVRYWRETGKRPDVCADPAVRSECSPILLAALRS